MLSPTKIFEFGDWFETGGRDQLRPQLEALWQANYASRDALDDADPEGPARSSYQGFVNFDGERARARNFIGFIQNEMLQLEIYPKIFKGLELNDANTSLILQHLFWWLDYCPHWRFPFTEVNLAAQDCSSLPELLINLMAEQFLSVVSAQPLLLYEEVGTSMSVPRGRINFERYLAKGFSYGNAHILECDYEPLVYDNQLNRAIKYVCRLLKSRARFYATQAKLDEVLFVLDEVSDEPCSSQSLNRVRLNNTFADYQPVINSCRLVLDSEVYAHQFYEQPQWGLLLPMELIFEDFISAFIRQELSADWLAETQKGGLSLVERPVNAFQMRHDLLLTSVADDTIQVIIDTKYKLREGALWSDPKKGVSQSDMYQMTAYGMRRGCRKVLLLYPNLIEICREPDSFFVRSAFDGQEIQIIAAEVPFWSMNDFAGLKARLSKQLTTLLQLI
jgi:5-methylcytosine-specific restriction enzyme subunit McrC